MYTLGIITSSDKGSRGERYDKSGEVIKNITEKCGFKVERYIVIPDEREMLSNEMKYMSDELGVDLVRRSGIKNFSERDVTPEATKDVIHKEALGIAEAIRNYSFTITKRAMLSRGTAGIRNKTLIVNMPGSPKACEEILDYILNDLKHGLDIMKGSASECARK